MEAPRGLATTAMVIGIAAPGLAGLYGGHQLGKANEAAAHTQLAEAQKCNDALRPETPDPKYVRRVELPVACLALSQTFERVYGNNPRVKAKRPGHD